MTVIDEQNLPDAVLTPEQGAVPKADLIAPITGRISGELTHVVGQNLKYSEFKDGLPVISAEDFSRMYDSDIRAFGADGSATFDFQGYMREDREGWVNHGQGVFFQDALATNGILRGQNHSGIHVGTDGIIDYNSEDNHEMKGPQEVGEYVMYVQVPTALQRGKGVVVTCGSCSKASECSDGPERVYAGQERFGQAHGAEPAESIVLRLGLHPRSDGQARRKVEIIHGCVVDFLENGGALDGVATMVRALEEKLDGLSEERMQKDYPLLGR